MASSLWFHSYVKLHFFNRVRRFLLPKASRKRSSMPSETSDFSSTIGEIEERIIQYFDPASVLQRTVKNLHFGKWEDKKMAAIVIERLVKENVKVRKLMVDLGVIRALVSMVDSDQLVAVKALIQLANDSLENRALIVEEGILSKLRNNTELAAVTSSCRHEFAELLLSLSSLANTELFLSSTQTVISFLLTVLDSESSIKTQNSCLATLFNISIVLKNAETLISNGVVPTLLRFSSVKELSEKSLPTLANLVMTSKGRKALETDTNFPEILVAIMRWEEKPRCQELSSYIIMMVAHQSSAQRERLGQSGIVGAILELALLGSPLAQKRALKLLQWFKDERQARVGPHSGPQAGRNSVGSGLSGKEVEEGKKRMRNLVEQSLCKNMETITRRANGGEWSSVRTLVYSTSSKSLPY